MKRKLVPATHPTLRKNFETFKIQAILFLLIVVCGKARALDVFEGIKCGADIPKSLIGKRDSRELVVVLEERHQDLRLKDLGGSWVSDRLFLVSWQICGSEYELLVNTKNGFIRDVLPFPVHSPTSPMFIGICQIDGKEFPEVIVAVLNNRAGYNLRDGKHAKAMLNASAAWRNDGNKEKFARQSTQNLRCPLIRIITEDGGP